MNFNQLLNSLVRKESETGELKSRFDPPEIKESLQKKKKQVRHGFELLLGRQSFSAELSNYQDDTSEGFYQSRFSIFLSRLKRRFPRYANGKLFSFITRAHQFVIEDRFQFWCGLVVGLIFWLGLISIYQWIFG